MTDLASEPGRTAVGSVENASAPGLVFVDELPPVRKEPRGWLPARDAHPSPAGIAALGELARSFEDSSYRASLFEQIFFSELIQACALAGLGPIEIDKPLVDFRGYDVVATCNSVTRHIQLKSTRGVVTVHRALSEKRSGCVVALEPEIDGSRQRIAFKYRFFGKPAGEPLDLSSLKAARKTVNTRAPSGEFTKANRLNHVQVPHKLFSGAMNAEQLAEVLFVPQDPSHA